MAFPRHESRLLTTKQAASYCSMSISAFAAHCPVKAVSLGFDTRLRRYDIRALDAWIDSLNQSSGQQIDWLSKLGISDEAV